MGLTFSKTLEEGNSASWLHSLKYLHQCKLRKTRAISFYVLIKPIINQLLFWVHDFKSLSQIGIVEKEWEIKSFAGILSKHNLLFSSATVMIIGI